MKIRIDAQNLMGTVLDTDKLSVVRGGSLRWRKSIVTLDDAVSGLKPISTGASIGQFDADKDLSPQVIQHLRKQYPELIFSVCAAKDDNEAKLKNRWQQFQQLTVPPERHSGATAICEFTKVRAGTVSVHAKQDDKDKHDVSWTVSNRHDFGRNEKNTGEFYARETGCDDIDGTKWTARKYANEFSDLALNGPDPALNGKLAVLYLDGNKFSKIITSENESCFDAQMAEKRKQLLLALMTWIIQKATKANYVPIEILLWGGDEYTFVLPASLGWEFMQRFFEASKDWKFEGKPLTHCAGLVFCHSKTPISRIQALARELADGIKQDVDSMEQKNAFDYLVLESVDFPAQSVTAFWNQRVDADIAQARSALLPNADWLTDAAIGKLDGLKNHQIYRLAHALAKGSPPQSIKDAKERLISSGATEQQIEAAQALFPVRDRDQLRRYGDWLWIHLRELRNYLLPQTEPAQSENAQEQAP